MITVTYNGESYTCTTALKGTDYIHLLDADGVMIAAFDGVSSFSGFTISGGGWTTPTPADECYLATIGDDGRILKGGHKCSDVTNHNHDGRYYTESEMDTALAGKAASDHNHNGVYSPVGHNHDDAYAAANHNHDSAYAAANHSHSEYASSSHNHDGTYATAGHNHSGVYATAGHNHSGTYAAYSHSHSEYASSGHTHSSFGSLSLNNTLILSSYTYGTTLPSAGNAGRIFFKKKS